MHTYSALKYHGWLRGVDMASVQLSGIMPKLLHITFCKTSAALSLQAIQCTLSLPYVTDALQHFLDILDLRCTFPRMH